MAAIETSDRKKTDDTSGDDSGEEDRASTTTADEDLVDDIKKWDGKKRPLVLVTAGGAGVGKSKLINNLLGLEGEQAAESDYSAKSVTKDVNVYGKVVNGVTVCIIDTPGFESRDLSKKRESEALAMISAEADGKADMLLYCMKLTSRFDAKDEYIVKKLTKAFGKEIWQHAILVLTHGDTVLEDKGKAKLKSLLEEFTKEFHEVLAKARVDVPVSPILSIGPGELESSAVNLNDGIVGIPVGKNKKNPEDWTLLLYKEVIKRCNSDAIPAILEIQGIAPLWVANALSGVTGVVSGGAAGTVAGGIIGGVIGAAVGAVVGGGIGALPGAAIGAGIGAGGVGALSALGSGIYGGMKPAKFFHELTGIATIIKARHLAEEKKKARRKAEGKENE